MTGWADAQGTVFPRAGADCRIVSLVPSLTELVCALDLVPQLVGRTGFCIHPRGIVRTIPKVGGTKDVNAAKVRALSPTHLLVNIDENEKPSIDALRPFVPNVVVTHPIDLDDNLGLFHLLGGIFDREAQAGHLAEALTTELTNPPPFPRELRALYLIWKDPWMTVGPQTYISRMLRWAGIRTVAPESSQRYPVVSLADFGRDACDLVLLSSEPYRFTERHRCALADDAALAGVPVALIDGEMVSWYGSRSIEGLRYLRDLRRRIDAAPAGSAG